MPPSSTQLASAAFVNIATFLPQKFVLIATVTALLGTTIFTRSTSCAACLEALKDLVIDTESAARESLGVLDHDSIVEVNHSLARLRLSLHNCHQNHRLLSSTPWHIYPLALIRLLWATRCASRKAQVLLNRIQTAREAENRRRLEGDVERTRI
ncbi:hypothetical protein C8J56DRAFT_1130099 [Mycena floridula]|nr:hypothetical protein C8J56DRAFT_1130099 [Mycena floridula]